MEIKKLENEIAIIQRMVKNGVFTGINIREALDLVIEKMLKIEKLK